MNGHQAALFIAAVVQALISKAGNPCTLDILKLHDERMVVIIEGMAAHT